MPQKVNHGRVGKLAIATSAMFLAGIPLPAAFAQATGNSTEISNSNDTTDITNATIPSGANVKLTDENLQNEELNRGNWTLHGRTYDNQRYSPLDQINTRNIKLLNPAALIQTGMAASFETTPIVVNGVMYATTPVVNGKMKILAYNAATGERYWSTTYDVGTNKVCCGPVNRGPAVAYGKVYVTTLDDKLLALDAKTGNKLWETQLADPRAGYTETMTPAVFNGHVIVGSSGGEWPIRGFVVSVDANTGREQWRWNSTDPKTFEGDSWKTGGGMVWTTPAVDPKRNMIIFAVGNPNPDLNGDNRKGDNLYTDSIVALNADTGKLKWHYQEVKHDVWDYDAVSNVVLFDVEKDGKKIPAAGEAGKVGWFFIVDRDTGKLITKSEPFVKMNDNMFKSPTKEGIKILPGANGGAEWSPPAYSPQTKDVYVLGMNQLMTFTTQKTMTIPGQMRLGSTFKNVKGDGGMQQGVLSAINVDTGKIDWQKTLPQPLMGGALATGGNLVFLGEGNGWFDAFDAKTGEKVWRYNLGAGVNAPPVSYEVDGVQYVAVAAGGNFQLDYPRGDVIAIFKLGSKNTAQQASR